MCQQHIRTAACGHDEVVLKPTYCPLAMMLNGGMTPCEPMRVVRRTTPESCAECSNNSGGAAIVAN